MKLHFKFWLLRVEEEVPEMPEEITIILIYYARYSKVKIYIPSFRGVYILQTESLNSFLHTQQQLSARSSAWVPGPTSQTSFRKGETPACILVVYKHTFEEFDDVPG